MDNRKKGLKELIAALAATVIILVISKILTNTILDTVSDEVYRLFYSKIIMAGLVLIAVIILRKMRIHLFRFRLGSDRSVRRECFRRGVSLRDVLSYREMPVVRHHRARVQ